MISTLKHSGEWVLVYATTEPSHIPAGGAAGSRAETIERFWTGTDWSHSVEQAQGFAMQSDALQYRDGNLVTMDAMLRQKRG